MTVWALTFRCRETRYILRQSPSYAIKYIKPVNKLSMTVGVVMKGYVLAVGERKKV